MNYILLILPSKLIKVTSQPFTKTERALGLEDHPSPSICPSAIDADSPPPSVINAND